MPDSTAMTKLRRILRSNADSSKRAVQLTEIADQLPEAAVDVLDDALATEDPLMQVAIMDAYFEMTGHDFHAGDLEDLMALARTMGDAGEQLYMAARVALGRITGRVADTLDEWGDGDVVITATARRRRRRRRRGRPRVINEITIIIHGTWASDGDWWQPGGNFFEYVKTDLGRSDLYGGADRFRWSGKNRDSKRRQAAAELDRWLRSHPAREVNVFGHSHGANVAMLATHKGIKMDRLIMMSPPVRSDYFANWSNVNAAYNIQAKWDPVVAIARGGQWFELPQVKEKKLRVSGHSESHEPDVWRSERLPAFVDMPW